MKHVLNLFIFIILFTGSTLQAAPLIVVPGEGSGYSFFPSALATSTSTSKFTVGAINVFISSTLPADWLECNGATVTRAAYPDLVTYLAGAAAASAVLPDLRGEFVRGWDNGRGLDAGRALYTVQAQSMLSHAHTASAAAIGDHVHTAWTSADGAHTHTIPNVSPPNTTGTYFGGGGGGMKKEPGPKYTAAAGSHSHTGSVNNAGTHTHTATINANGGTEFRPRNRSVLFAIRATVSE